jgi:hypothetical protein
VSSFSDISGNQNAARGDMPVLVIPRKWYRYKTRREKQINACFAKYNKDQLSKPEVYFTLTLNTVQKAL